jgi:hypothetical protein
MLDCLKNIVGVTDTETDCITGGLAVDEISEMKKSTSTLYLDNLPGGIHLKAVKYADATKGLYKMSTGAIQTAATILEKDLLLALNQNHAKSRKNFVGQIGRLSFAQSLGVTGDWQGLRIRPVDKSDAIIILSKITNIISTAATYNFYLYKVPYRSAVGQLIGTYPVTSLANQFHSAVVDGPDGKRLPLTENGEAIEYWVIWNRTEAGGGIPKDNKLACSTCDKVNGTPAGEYLEVNGVDFDDINNLQNVRTDDYSHGLTLDIVIKCDNQQLFCRQYAEDDAVAVAMAYAVWFKAGELLIEDVLKSPDLNRYTTMDKERLWGKRNHFRAEYDGRIPFLAATIDITDSNCFVCREAINQPFPAGIFS